MPAYVLRTVGRGPAPDLGESYGRREVLGHTYVWTDSPTCMRRLMHAGYELSGYTVPEPELAVEEVEVVHRAHAEPGLLDLSVRAVEHALATGEYDARLDEFRAAEAAGKGRKGVLAALDDRARAVRQEE